MNCVKIKNVSDNHNPKYQTTGSACADVYSNGECVIKPGEMGVVGTGLYFEIPFGFQIKVYPRSGMAFKNGVTLINAPGVIDSDYRGELKVCLVNHGKEDFNVFVGDRIAQISIEPVHFINWIDVDNLSDTIRGDGGLGSTGNR